MNSAPSPKILVAPLDWGLGHATRCIPVIQTLLDCGAQVVLGGEGATLKVLEESFHNLKTIELSGYRITYPKHEHFVFHFARKIPQLLSIIKKEHQLLQRIISQENLQGVISDNRYGLWSQQVPSVFITHQLRIQSPVLEGVLQRWNYRFIRRFQKCWVPDYEGSVNLAGALSHPLTLPPRTQYIGPLSRMTAPESSSEIKYDYIGIVSGPEPQRQQFADLLKAQLRQSNRPAMLVLGQPQSEVSQSEGKLEIRSHLSGPELRANILQSRLVICRSGYSSLMDLDRLGAPALLVPTPGQTEQEYLARLHHGSEQFRSVKQSNFNLSKIAQDLPKAMAPAPESPLLKKVVSEFVRKLK